MSHSHRCTEVPTLTRMVGVVVTILVTVIAVVADLKIHATGG